MARRDRQLALALPPPKAKPTWGGKRAGAGRKPRPENARRPPVKHLPRPELNERHPVHVTLRRVADLPSLRTQTVLLLLEEVFDDARRDDGQIVHFSVQADHVHLIVEANDRRALSSLLRRVAILFALRLNARIGRRRGKIWGDRYHRRDLVTPREVKNALVYLFTNAAKHGVRGASRFVPDAWSSALGDDTWDGLLPAMREAFLGGRIPWKPPEPRTWLLRTGWWKIHGRIVVGDAAKGARGSV